MADQKSLTAFLAPPPASKAVAARGEPLISAYVALFERFPKMTCFLSGVVLATVVFAPRETPAPEAPWQ